MRGSIFLPGAVDDNASRVSTCYKIRERRPASIAGISRIQFSADDKLEFMKWAWKAARESFTEGELSLAREVQSLPAVLHLQVPSSPPRTFRAPPTLVSRPELIVFPLFFSHDAPRCPTESHRSGRQQFSCWLSHKTYHYIHWRWER